MFDLTERVWRRVKNYENLYVINSHGEIMNVKTGKFLKHTKLNTGYYSVALRGYNGKFKRFLLHRLLAESFIDNLNNKPMVNHKDGDKTNNNLNNLEWCTLAENLKHAAEHDLYTKGSNHYRSNLTEEDVFEIKLMIKFHIPTKKIAELYNVKSYNISDIKSERSWKHVKI